VIAALILVISVAALLQFFVSYCRSVIAASCKRNLSEHARKMAGIENRFVRGDEFERLLQLVQLCPEPGDDGRELRAVGSYFGLLSLLRSSFGRLAPAVANWAEREREGCAYFAAVALDRRITHSRDLMAEQMSNQL
jgi:hypothetical protein